MAHAPMRRRCPQCRLVQTFRRPTQITCSPACDVERRKAAGLYRRAWVKSREVLAAKTRTLAGFGVLTAREAAIYQRGRENALTYSRWSQREAGRRQGWAEALGEGRRGRAA